MKDQFRHENLQPSQVQAALREFENMGFNPQMLQKFLSSAEDFNAKPLEMRQQFFAKVAASEPMRTSAQGERPPMRIDIQGVAPDPLESIIQERMKTAPKGQTLDLDTVLAQRIEGIKTGKKEAAAKEAAIQQAAVPQIDASGRVVRDVEQPRKTRSMKDYLVGGGEALLTTVTGGVMAPIAAAEQLGADILTKAAGKKPTTQDVFKKRMAAGTYAPRTEAGQEVVGVLGEAFEASKLPPVLTPEFMALSAAGRVPPRAPKEAPEMGPVEAAQTRAIIEGTAPQFRQDPPGLPGLASVGAAGRRDPVAIQAAIDALPFEYQAEALKTPMNKINLKALESHGQALNLPVPIFMTRGQATQDIVALSNELNRRGELTNIANRIKQQNDGLVQNLTVNIREMAAPDISGTKSSDFGQIVIDNYKSIDDVRRANIGDLYRQLEQAAGGDFPIDSVKFVRTADQQLSKKLKSEFLPPSIDRQLQAYRNGAKMDFEQFEALRTNLATEIRKAERAGDGNAAMALSVVRDALESLPLSGEAAALKPLADAARFAAKERFDALKRDPAYKAAVEETVAPENFVSTFVLSKGKGTEKNVRTMIEALGKGSEGQQAIAADILAYLTERAIDGKGAFSQASFNKALREIDPKMLEIFDPATAKTLKDLGEVSRKVMAQPSGSFANNSNTFVASLARKMETGAEQALNIAVPYLSLGTAAMQRRAARKAEKFEERSLKPLAGIEGESNLIRDLLNKREQ
jgi:hypothetical protein